MGRILGCLLECREGYGWASGQTRDWNALNGPGSSSFLSHFPVSELLSAQTSILSSSVQEADMAANTQVFHILTRVLTETTFSVFQKILDF